MNITEFARYIDRRSKEADVWHSLQRREWAQKPYWEHTDDETIRWVYENIPMTDENTTYYVFDSVPGGSHRVVTPVQKLVSVEDLL